MRRVIIFLFITTALGVNAQSSFDLMGALFMPDVRPISYRLLLEEDKGQVNGYSITGLGTDFETKSELFGKLEGDSLFLNEFQVLSTLSEEPIANFCFIDIRAQLWGAKRKRTFKGVFEGYLLDGSQCARGKVIFADKVKIEKKMKQVQKVQELIEDKKNDNKLVKIGANETYEALWLSDVFKIHLWDSSQEDDDKITLIINGKKILNNEVMRTKKKKITHALQKGINMIELIAESEGKAPHNTTRIELIDKNTKHAILSQLEVGKKVMFKIIH